jgi:hypothetical protein
MLNTKLPQSLKNVFTGRPNGVVPPSAQQGVVQDKRAFASARPATSQPASQKPVMRAQPLDKKLPRSQTRPTPKRRTEQLTLWVNPVVKAELQRKAAQEGISLSAAGRALLERAVQGNIDMQYSAFLQPVIEHAIQKYMQGMSNRLAWLLVRVAYDAGQTRNLVTTLLNRQPDMKPHMLKAILEQSGKSARWSVTRKSPELMALMEELEQWLRSDEDEEQKPHG